MTGATFYGLYEGLWGFVRRLTSHSAAIDATISSAHRSLVEQNGQGRTDARPAERSASLTSSQTMTTGSHTVSSASRPSSIARPSTPHTPNQPVFHVPQPPQAPRAPPRAPRTARVLMPPLSPLDLDSSNPNSNRASTSARPALRNLPSLDPAYERAKRGEGGPLQRPHAARPSPMGLTRTGTLIIGDPDYTGPLHEMQSVHALGRRHVLRADRESNVSGGREDERRHNRAPTPPIPDHGAVSSPDVRRRAQRSQPIASTSSAPAGIVPRSNARNRRLLRANQQTATLNSGPSGSSTAPLLPAITGPGLMVSTHGSQAVQAPEPGRRRRRRTLGVASTPSSRTLRTSTVSSGPSPLAQEAPAQPVSQAGPSHQGVQAVSRSSISPATATTSKKSPKSGNPHKRAREADSTPSKATSMRPRHADSAPGPSQENGTRPRSTPISPLRLPRRRDPSTESRWSSAAVARGDDSPPHRPSPEPAAWDAEYDNAERRKRRRTDADEADRSSTWSAEATRGGPSRHPSWEWDRSVNEAIQTWSTAATDGGFGSRRGSMSDFDDPESSMSPLSSESGGAFELPLDILAGVLGSPFTSRSSSRSSTRKRSREEEEPLVVRPEERDFNAPDSEVHSSPASTIYSLGQSPRPSSRDPSEPRRLRRDGTHSDPESHIPEQRPGGTAPPRKRHRSY